MSRVVTISILIFMMAMTLQASEFKYTTVTNSYTYTNMNTRVATISRVALSVTNAEEEINDIRIDLIWHRANGDVLLVDLPADTFRSFLWIPEADISLDKGEALSINIEATNVVNALIEVSYE